MSNIDSEHQRYLEYLTSIEEYYFIDLTSWGGCTFITQEGVSDEPAGDHEIIVGPVILSQEQYGAIANAIKNKTEKECPENWDAIGKHNIYEIEWSEGIYIVNNNCDPDTEYFAFHLDEMDDREFIHSLEEAEEELRFTILVNSGRPNLEAWENMNTSGLEYWYEEVKSLKENIK